MKKLRETRGTPEKPRVTEYIPKLDDYDLPSEFPLDPAKMKPNPYAGRVKLAHGGRRLRAGRKSAPEPVERHTLVIYKSHADYLRSLDPSLSKALRKLIAAGKS